MIFAELLSNPAVPRALVVGAFGGAGLILTMTYSRRGPLIYPVYAALLAALALLLARYSSVPFAGRFAAAFAGVAVATALAYIATGVHASRARERLQREGRLPPNPLGISALGHLWRLSGLVALGMIASAGVAFLAT